MNLSAARLRHRLATTPGLTAPIEVTEDSAAPYAAMGESNAVVLMACRQLDLRSAKITNPALAWTQITSAGVETWLADLPPGMLLTNASGVHGPKGAEFILTACLMLNFGIPGFVTDKEQRAWRPSFGGPIAGRTVTLLGVGGIGQAARATLQANGVTVIGITRNGRKDADGTVCLPVAALDSVLPRTDILVSTLPLTIQTRNLVNRARLESLPPGAGVVVVGRAGVVDYDALGELLGLGRLGGAVIDVFPQEPLPKDDKLWSCPRLVMTPHCSLDDHIRYMDACLDIFCANVVRYVAGERLSNLVDPALGY